MHRDGYWFIERATKYANERVVFDRPIGKTRACSSRLPMPTSEVEAANLIALQGGRNCFDARPALRRRGEHGKVSWPPGLVEAANVCVQTHGGFGFACEYSVERKSVKLACTR